MKDIHEPISSVNDDMFERASLAKTMLERIGEKNYPTTVGLYGGWGTGKSSVLNLIREIVQKGKSKKFHIEIFDAWKYESTGNLFIPIVTRLNKPLESNFDSYSKRIIEITSLFLSDIALRKTAGISLNEVINYRVETEKALNTSRWSDWVDEIEKTNEDFSLLVNSFLKKIDKKRLIICVDNLDRCSPENAIRLLESIKNFMVVPNCVWLFAIDDDVMASYIDKKYDGTKIDGHSFLDKIITEQYHIPSLGGTDIRELFWRRFDIEVDFNLEIDRLNYLFTPRKIAKVGSKYKQFVSNDRLGLNATQKQLLFCLIFLYFTWPDFYKFLESGNSGHLRGILANYYEGTGISTSTEMVKVPNKFQNPDIVYFMRVSFIESLPKPSIYFGSLNNEAVEDLVHDLFLRINNIDLL